MKSPSAHKRLFQVFKLLSAAHLRNINMNCQFFIQTVVSQVLLIVYMFEMQFDVTFPVIPCSLLSLDAVDISGEQHLDIVCTAKRTLVC